MSSDFYDGDLPFLDRSTLERYGNCPMSARLAETSVKSVGDAANIGEEAHRAISRTIANYLDSYDTGGVMMSASDLQETLGRELRSARADCLSDAWHVMRSSLWRLPNLLETIHPHNILRFDGGTGERSGQLARTIPRVGLATSEIDLLFTPPKEWGATLREIDWKSGRKIYSEANVRDSFQFRLHACLVFESYPEINTLMVQVFNLRPGILTRPVEFRRSDDITLWAEIQQRAGDWYLNHNKPPGDAEARPSRDKCRICECAAMCSVVDRDIADVAADPEAAVRWFIAVHAHLAMVKNILKGHVEVTETDIVTSDGDAFGYLSKPSTPRWSANPVYHVSDIVVGEDEDDDESIGN
jgi:hypothetical protein